jgi:twitching motility protein PilT
MPGVDQILSAIVQQGADELRLGVDQAPTVLALGTPRRFTMSPTPDAVLRHLLGDLLTAERRAELEQQRRVIFEHEATAAGRFKVVLVPTVGGAFNATFTLLPKGARIGRGDGARRDRSESDRTDAGRTEASVSAEAVLAASAKPGPVLAPGRTATREAAPAAIAQRAMQPVPAEGGPSDASVGSSQLFELVERAARSRVSDIHLEDGQPPYWRVDGKLQALADAPRQVAEYFRFGETEHGKLRTGAAHEFSLEAADRRRLRVSVYATEERLAAAIRLLPNAIPALADLNLPVPLEELSELPHGLVLFCGATGSGKSTTMAALCQRALAERSILLITLEDPIEFALSSTAQSLVRQRQVGRDVASYQTGLRDALRGDPDVIMVGELRDAESIQLAMTAAETGHLVFASLHSGSAAACLERVMDAYPAEQRSAVRAQLAEALRAVVVQKLVPRARGKGRIPALEVLRVNHAVANVIREGRTAQLGTLLQSGKRDGMISLERCLADYVQSAAISLECAKAAANDFDSLAMYLSK